jgi:hypothetical protein
MTTALPLRHFVGRRVVIARLPRSAGNCLARIHGDQAVGVVLAGATPDGRCRVEFPLGYGESDGVRRFYVPGECLRPAKYFPAK